MLVLGGYIRFCNWGHSQSLQGIMCYEASNSCDPYTDQASTPFSCLLNLSFAVFEDKKKKHKKYPKKFFYLGENLLIEVIFTHLLFNEIGTKLCYS